jgi:hypothetical protein
MNNKDELVTANRILDRDGVVNVFGNVGTRNSQTSIFCSTSALQT